MMTFFAALALLFIGCHTYGRLAESLFGPDDRPAAFMSACATVFWRFSLREQKERR